MNIALDDYDLSSLDEEEAEQLLLLLKQRDRYVKTNKIEDFEPYPFQKMFYDASKGYKRRFLCAANRIGKSYSESMEVAWHATGKYPKWWVGHRFTKPPLIWCVGITGESTQKVMQKEVFGTMTAKDTLALGTGTIPRKCIDFDGMIRDGARVLACKIKFHDPNGVYIGDTVLEFRSTQQGEHVLMGATVDYIWLDEEDPFRSMQIYSQCVTRTATTGGLVTITATPENGLTELVNKFRTDSTNNLYFQQATWDDAPHITSEIQKELLASIPDWQHDMRTKGEPMMGSGLIYPIDLDGIKIDPFKIPGHWPRVCAVDIGITHDTAAVWSTQDPDTGNVYVYDAYHANEGTPHIHAPAINARGGWIPVILPHDADNTERGSGKTVSQYYGSAGVNVMMQTFHNPIDPFGKTNNFVEPGLMNLLQMMKTGRLKIFTTCPRIFEEMRRYHRKDGKINKTFDDTVDAMRYSVQSLLANRGVTENEAEAGVDSAYHESLASFSVNY